MSEEKKDGFCPCNCGKATVGGRYAHGHKPKINGGIPQTGAGGKLLVRNLLLIEADDELCDKIWGRLRVDQKVAALNSLKH